MAKDDEPVLPADIKKEIVKEGKYPKKVPKTGDEVRIHYTGSKASDGSQFASSRDGKPYFFKLGTGMVMEAWDRVVATMRSGETAKFTIPEMYLNGGSADLLTNIPEDCTVIYEIELVSVIAITDLFNDGGAVLTEVDQGEDYGKQPKAGDEVILNYEVRYADGQIADKQPALNYKIGVGYVEGLVPGKFIDNPEDFIPNKVMDKSLLTMKRKQEVSLVCRAEYAYGDSGCANLSVPPKAGVTVKLVLDEVCEFEDVGKKSNWSEGLVMKKVVRVERARQVPGMDGTRCKVHMLKALSEGTEIEGPQTFEFIPGDGELCDALECACARMRKSEVALVTVRGPANLRTPGKPEGASASAVGPVVYHLEMLEFDRAPPEDGPSNNEERLTFCVSQKERGSAHFRSGRFRLAQERYERILKLLPRYKREEGSSSVHVEFFEYEEQRQRAQELRNTCKLNLAACTLKLEEYYAAAKYCSDVLQDDSQNLKALYRRAQAHLGTKDFDDATRDCKRVLELDAGHKEAQVLLQKVARSAKEERQKSKSVFAGKLRSS